MTNFNSRIIITTRVLGINVIPKKYMCEKSQLENLRAYIKQMKTKEYKKKTRRTLDLNGNT